jgi:hypothetical protein
MNNIKKIDLNYLITTLLILATPTLSLAYVGPGAGITFLGALWAVITAIVLAVGGFLVWPIRAFIRRRKLNKQDKTVSNNSTKNINK